MKIELQKYPIDTQIISLDLKQKINTHKQISKKQPIDTQFY